MLEEELKVPRAMRCRLNSSLRCAVDSLVLRRYPRAKLRPELRQFREYQ
jgi:hypothetical protein